MRSTRFFKQGLTKVFRHWDDEQYDLALSEVELLLKSWPGNASLHILWANLVELQNAPSHSLREAKKALLRAIDLDMDSPEGVIELGHYLDAMEANPRAASKAFAKGIRSARRLLKEGLLGQMQALIQLDKKEEVVKCVKEWLYLANIGRRSANGKSVNTMPDIGLRDPLEQISALPLKGPFAAQIKELLHQLFPERFRNGSTGEQAP